MDSEAVIEEDSAEEEEAVTEAVSVGAEGETEEDSVEEEEEIAEEEDDQVSA